jgi:hypothetical protein
MFSPVCRSGDYPSLPLSASTSTAAFSRMHLDELVLRDCQPQLALIRLIVLRFHLHGSQSALGWLASTSREWGQKICTATA